MRVAVFMSNKGGSPLSIGIERGIRMMGHEVANYAKGVGSDLILVYNQSAHIPDYVYPEFPSADDKTPIAFIDNAEYGMKRVREPERFVNAFSSGSVQHDTKNEHQQGLLRTFLEGRSFPYLLREYANAHDYPENYHPIDYPLYGPSTSHKKPERENYLKRAVDVACIWGLSHPWRVNLTHELDAAQGLRKDVYAIERDGPRLPQRGGPNSYFDRLKAARCSISFDGYGSGSFRMTEVLVRTLLMQGPLSIRTRAPLEHGVTCWAYCVWVDGEHYIRSNLVEQIHAALSDPVRAFQIYERGYHHCMAHLTERATAKYVLDTVQSHDYTRPTKLTLEDAPDV